MKWLKRIGIILGIVLGICVVLVGITMGSNWFETGSPLPTAASQIQPRAAQDRGDTILDCNLARGDLVVSAIHTGERRFVVRFQDKAGNRKSLISTSGGYNGSKLLRVGHDINPGPCYIEITADGYWTIEIKDR